MKRGKWELNNQGKDTVARIFSNMTEETKEDHKIMGNVTAKKRKVLIILTNRLDRNHKPRFIELTTDELGDVHREKLLRSRPRKPAYDEVWENDDGKTEWAACKSFK